jgi:hypothetical protein
MISKLLVSFSGGETSAYMIDFIKRNLSYDRVEYVFANTGLEHEKTLEFVQKVADYHQIKVHWIEAVINQGRKSAGHKLVDFETASRRGEPFEAAIQKYGIPNMSFPHCSRILKKEVIESFAKNYLNWKDNHFAIGIRADESDRASVTAKKQRLIYPLIKSITKPIINQYWDKMPFRLEIPGYIGNCTACWKKSDRKLIQVGIEEPSAFDFFREMEQKYENFVPPYQEKGRSTPIRFYRHHRKADDFALSDRVGHTTPSDERMKGLERLPLLDLLDDCIGKSCEAFNTCGDSCEAFQ